MAYLTVSPRPAPAGVVWTRTSSPVATPTPTPCDVVTLTPVAEASNPSAWTLAQAGGWLSSLGPRLGGQAMRDKDMSRYSRSRPEEPVDQVEIALEEEEASEPTCSDELKTLLERLVPRQPGRAPLLRLWLLLGVGLIERCALAGVTTWAGAANRYERGERRLRVCLALGEREALAGLAQACDHALGGEEFASRSAMAVLTLCPGQAPEEFFSRSLAGHVSGERGALSPYLDYLLTRSSHPGLAVGV